MTLLILLSTCVSLVTLGILLFNRSIPFDRRIPSAFLGGLSARAPLRLRVTTPPWLAWLCVLIGTLGAGLAYVPPAQNSHQPQGGQAALLWVDTTLSAQLSRHESSARAGEISGRISGLGMRIFGLEETLQWQQGAPVIQYALVPIQTGPAIEDFLKRQFERPPSPFARPLVSDELSKILQASSEFADGNGLFVAITDAQRETLQNLSVLKPFFSGARLVTTPMASTLLGSLEEIIPAELFGLWGEQASLGASEFALFDAQKSHIPRQARPGLTRESFASGEKNLAFISHERGEGGKKGNEQGPGAWRLLPMITGCASQLSGPLELDSFADLKAFAQFFDAPLRLEHCREESGEVSPRSEPDPWKYRPQTIWVVQVTEEISGTLTQKKEFWIPQGFVRGSDSLVYVASHTIRAEGGQASIERTPVQLDAEGFPTPLLLMPPPPMDILQLNPKSLEQGAPVEAVAQTVFKPLYAAADKTPLGYKAEGFPIYYLRTTVAMPNGELGRSSSWTHFWLQMAGATGPDQANVLRRSYADASAFIAEATKNGTAWMGFNETLNVSNLTFEAQPQERDGNAQPSVPVKAGLYRNGESKTLLLWSYPSIERSRNLLTDDEFSALWQVSQDSSAMANESQTKSRAKPMSLFGGIMALAALFFLWFFKPARAITRPTQPSPPPPGTTSGNVTSTLGLLLICLGGAWHVVSSGTQAFAYQPLVSQNLMPQNLVSQNLNTPVQFQVPRSFLRPPGRNPRSQAVSGPQTIPFRVAWCDADIPGEVAKRYLELRDLLASRGTIELPNALTAGGCRPGAADIWWTADAAALDPVLLAGHISSGGVFLVEGQTSSNLPANLTEVADPSIGMSWEVPQKRGLLYRSFYLLQTFDGCPNDKTRLLTLRKKVNAHSPVGLYTSARFLTEGTDCFATDADFRARSFVNLLYSILATDYKEDQLQLPEILNRVRNLGLEP